MDIWKLPNDTKPDNETLIMLNNSAVSVILPVVYSIVALVSIPGNLLSLWILGFHSKPITSSIILMINLSVADLVLAIFLPFQIIYHVKGHHWMFGEGLCNVVSVLFYANMYCSILTIMAISIERYLGIVHPMKSSTWRRKRYAVAAILFIWTFTLTYLYPLESTDLTYRIEHLNITTCFDVLKWTMLPNLAAWAMFIIGLFCFFFLFPSIVTVICYTCIICTLARTSNRGGTGHERRPIKLALIVLVVFITCFAPNNFILIVHTINRLFFSKSYYPAYKLTLTMSSLSSCLDPFLYYFASKEFRKKVLEVWAKTLKKSGNYDRRRGSLFSGTFSSGHAETTENGNGYKYNLQESDL
uniref:P2Y receptor family member 8 n=1 Tax=Leptobrachium leishanense TaxID=445787 RepID=A0A8C5M3I5_9ANUR